MTTDWRTKVRRALLPDIECLSPMRDKDFLKAETSLGEGYTDVLATQGAITTRDALDIGRADLLLVNFLGSRVASQGTLWEIGYSKGLHKPIILVMEPEGNVHDTFFVRASANVRVDSLPQALDIVRSFLLPG